MKTTREQKRTAVNGLKAKICLRAFSDVARRIDRLPKNLQRRTILAVWAIISP